MTPVSAPEPIAFEWRVPWEPVVRGLRWGDATDRVLLLHELGADIDAWGPLPVFLATRLPLAVIAVDLPGHGLSDDPWEGERLAEVVRELAGDRSSEGRRDGGRSSPSTPLSQRSPAPSYPPLPVRRERGEQPPRDRPVETPELEAVASLVVIAAGMVALATLDLAAELALAGLVCLSPGPASEEGQSFSRMTRSPKVPKLFVAGSRAGDDLATARRLATASGGWVVVNSVPVAERGTGLLATGWQRQMCEHVAQFTLDCLRTSPDVHRNPLLPGGMPPGR